MDNSTWSSWNVLTSLILSASGGNYNPNVSRIPGTYTQFGIWTIDNLDVYSSEKISNSIYCDITACVAPTACSVSATLAEGNVTLSWSGASGGAGNAIISYEIQYSDSADNSTWGAWTALTAVFTSATSGSLIVKPTKYTRELSPIPGKNTRCSRGKFLLRLDCFQQHCSKKHSAHATDILYRCSCHLRVQHRNPCMERNYTRNQCYQAVCHPAVNFDDGINWSAYEALTIIVSSATSGTYTANASQIAGMHTRYRISVTDTLDAVSAFVVSGIVKKNSPPTAPTIVCPVSGGSSYNVTPRVMIITGPEPDGQTQIAEVKIDAGAWVNSVDNPEMFSVSGYLGNGVKTVFQAPTLAAGNHTLTMRCWICDIGSSSPEVVRTFTVLSPSFETITANETNVKANLIQTLRMAVNTVRSYYNLSL